MIRRLLIAGLLSIATTVTVAEDTLPPKNLLFILDTSDSMWGRIEGTPKIGVAKEVMSGLVKDQPAESMVGLGPLERQAIIERIEDLNPKGKTPITDAVKQAIGELWQREASANVVLVSDGLESCDGDPCEADEAAKKSSVDFRMHVVGFDLGETDASQLQCMEKAGGGEYYTAANAGELTGALEQAVQVRPTLVLKVTRNGKPAPAKAPVYASDSGDKVEHIPIGITSDENFGNPACVGLEPGQYDVEVMARAMERKASR